ncbi:MAG: hypothetical protein SWO11_23105, partial [Thermodesulfobacteriota bacterium]|nr:hypothetical protein [Thermodesulfobacteriota bacterium]
YSHRSILLTWDCRGCSLSRLNQPNRCYVIRMPGGVRGGKPRGFSLSHINKYINTLTLIQQALFKGLTLSYDIMSFNTKP